MATNPATATQIQTITPVFQRIPQENNHDCIFACLSMLTNQSLMEIKNISVERFGLNRYGPYWVGEELIAKILANFGLVSTVWKEVVNGIEDLPDIAIAMVDYDPETELGRNVIFVRDRSNPKLVKTYYIDCGYWIDPSLHVRTDLDLLPPAWFIGVHKMSRMSK
jgi:hypothetical protein